YACENWHYSKSMPTPPRQFVGAWEDGAFIGVVIFSRGNASGIGKPYGLKQTEVCELTRVAMRNHVTPVSRILRFAIKFLKQRSPGIKLLVSYADPGQDHHGGIYQASNWIYTGTVKV